MMKRTRRGNNADGRPVLEVCDISKSFDGVKALDSVSLSFLPGLISSVIGLNGAGKTTLFHVISGYLKPDCGHVLLRGADITSMAPHKVAAMGVGRLFQDVRIFPRMTVLDNALVAAELPGEDPVTPFLCHRSVDRAVNTVIDAVRAHLDFVGLLPKSSLYADQLSFGEQKMLAIARLLTTDADVLLLDEPASGVESSVIEAIFNILRTLAGRGKTIVVIEHDVSLVLRQSDEVLLLDGGRVAAAGTPSSVFLSEAFQNAYPGVGWQPGITKGAEDANGESQC
jgi:ABC-type branched-subunit amino acid transport system ATPase component